LRLARGTLESGLALREPPPLDLGRRLIRLTPALEAVRGAFVTLRHRSGELRGCIGRVEPTLPLWRTVMECAFASATRDPRFEALSAAELAFHRIEISVLTAPEPIPPASVEPGRHGLLVSHGASEGLLLPQVASENDWDRDTLLGMVCRKAGLPQDAWRKGARLCAFEAEVFSEDSDREPPSAAGDRDDR
jgi:AmmeMemoRadiSam system protein A